jgi:hypothetical protein
VAAFSIKSEIAGSSRDAWDVFNNLPEYEKWNPFIVAAVGTIRHGVELDLKIKTPTGAVKGFRPHVEAVERGKSVTWSVGNMLFARRTTFKFAEPAPGRVSLTVDVEFRGLLAPMRKGFVDLLQNGYQSMVDALKKEVESGARAPQR